jgi:hypothetical protein
MLGAGTASAVTFNDATGENFDGNAHMDIVSVDVTNTATDITFLITLNGSIANPTDWGKYLVGISTSPATGDVGSPVGNPWGRNITMADGMDAWLGSWVDSGGGALAYTYAGGSWTQNGGTLSPVLGANSTTITASLASLGLIVGQTIQFDVYTSGGNGGDSANDALANPSQSTTGWSGPYTTASGAGVSYTLVPEPGVALLGVLGAAMVGLRRRCA